MANRFELAQLRALAGHGWELRIIMAQLEFDPFRYVGLTDQKRADAAGERFRLYAQDHHAVMVGDLMVEIRSLANARTIRKAWLRLSRNTVEPNIFLEPDFVLAAEQHLPETAGHAVLLVWGPRGEDERRLLGLWVMVPARQSRFVRLTRGMTSRYACSGAPLLDQQFAVEAAAAMIAGLADLEPSSSGALFQEIALDGAAARIMRAAATLNGLSTLELAVHKRACLWPPDGGPTVPAPQLDGKTRRELNRQARGLSQHGDVRIVKAQSPVDVRVALEIFLALEASGWKARRGTSILSQTRDSSFCRSMTRALSRNGQIEIHLLEAGQRVIAAGLVLKSGSQSWYLKTAYDEAFAAYGPGTLLSHLIGQSCMNDPDTQFVDSCAVPGHQMIERIWESRCRVGDLVVSLKPDADNAIAREQLRRRTRSIAKRCYHKLRGWLMP